MRTRLRIRLNKDKADDKVKRSVLRPELVEVLEGGILHDLVDIPHVIKRG